MLGIFGFVKPCLQSTSLGGSFVNISVKKFALANLACAAVCVGLLVSMSASAFAEIPVTSNQNATLRAGILATYNAYKETRNDLARGYLERLAKKNLDVLVAEGCDRLRTVGELELADQLQTEWTNQVSTALTARVSAAEFGTLELGDFDPLSPWLDNFYNTLYYKTKGLVKGVRVIHDIYLMNYALAVVFKPNGGWRLNTSYDRIEYRKHFIPFANTVTFWTAVKACQHYLPQYKKYCDQGSGYLESFMGKHIAPYISDSIFRLVSHQHATVHQFNELEYQSFENEMTSEKQTAFLLEE